ncbi:hypothetical protein DFH07DRAFT_86652 [Mycena maculata]|uniref:Uncharacterized protein n=1 Tax=Mycena maculata TaxID=230809 RepID=A0AAD7IAV9_9AGAR|nr:hypothetical protein DFH07DRAFT_86652 [Mycena maculata]
MSSLPPSPIVLPRGLLVPLGHLVGFGYRALAQLSYLPRLLQLPLTPLYLPRGRALSLLLPHLLVKALTLFGTRVRAKCDWDRDRRRQLRPAMRALCIPRRMHNLEVWNIVRLGRGRATLRVAHRLKVELARPSGVKRACLKIRGKHALNLRGPRNWVEHLHLRASLRRPTPH